ncbi:MAG: hypothetical protein ABII12_02625 [Planctomycetota bacterium]
MSKIDLEIKFASKDYWRRFLKRAVALLEARDARRLGKRYPFSMDGRILFTVGDRASHADIAVLDVSAEGIMGVTQHEIPVRADVRVEIAPEGTIFALRGRTVHSTQSLGGYKTGIELSFVD